VVDLMIKEAKLPWKTAKRLDTFKVRSTIYEVRLQIITGNEQCALLAQLI